MYTYLLDTYKENDLVYDTYNKSQLESKLAYDGDYKAYFEFIADSLKRYSSQRDKQKGEAFVHGFTLAMASQCRFYRPISELDNDGGYADIFLSPLCDIYKDMVDSYIIELKYCKTSTTDQQMKELLKEVSAQITRYADSDIVRNAIQKTTAAYPDYSGMRRFCVSSTYIHYIYCRRELLFIESVRIRVGAL